MPDTPAPSDHSEYWHQLNDALDKASRDYDRTVLTLAGGSLVVSIAFLRDIAPEPTCIVLVVVAWGLLFVSLASILVSFYTSEKALLYSAEKFNEGVVDATRGGAWGTATDVLNRVAGGTFLMGALFLVIFAIINLPEGG